MAFGAPVTPTLIDTDPGIDDALALLLAWGSPEISVLALTTVAGNVPVAQASLNARRLCALRRPRPWPMIAEGAAAPLARPLRTAIDYHGHDGLGDVGDWPEPLPSPSPGAAVEVLTDVARRYGEQLTIVALGPLTNLAQALERDAGALRRVGRIVVMGGAVAVPGNVTADAEFNIFVDPDAARVVFEAGLALELVPLDATRQAMLSRTELDTCLAAYPGPFADRIRAFTARGFLERGPGGGHGMTLHDPLAVGAAIDPTLVAWEPLRLAIGNGGQTRPVPGDANCRVAMRVDRARFIELFLGRCCPREA
jgi:purine nucleosidase/pyrimidine-specific ribonucleoside hydrolase